MSTPQQPELRRSEETPSLAPDAIEGELDARDRPSPKGETGPVPEANKPGTKSGPEQDKPDLDKFAAKFGIDEKDPSGERAHQAAEQQVAAAREEDHGLLGTGAKVAVGAAGLAVGAVAWAVPKIKARAEKRSRGILGHAKALVLGPTTTALHIARGAVRKIA